LFINKYRAEEIVLSSLIDILESSIDALEEKLPQEWVSKWIELVSHLEICSVLGLENERKTSIEAEIDHEDL
jgi:hypothetical protein